MVIDLEAKRTDRERAADFADGTVCACCGKPDTDTGREHDLYCDPCLEQLYAENE